MRCTHTIDDECVSRAKSLAATDWRFYGRLLAEAILRHAEESRECIVCRGEIRCGRGHRDGCSAVVAHRRWRTVA